ncbi:MAG TPA: toxic anion resistance protein [Candidatus Ornithomonoglobus merdipullorum]|uniref:Toxic anion resistance protein n=1 Tax=Candidatus Ornithomonoglobus merdipullorum TaxID=2840895 RepID=A0A9D1M9E6_9FIRM|nr:toxic anion resistance protein [Candidatus Ornithomonoglobus merdipullorum]
MEIEKPSLTLTPDLSVPAQEPAPAPQPAAELGEEASLTDEEKAMVESFASQIDIKNPSMVLQYGAGTQQKMASFSEKALESVQTKDLGEVGDMLTDIVKELQSFDAVEEDKGGIFKIFRKASDKIDNLKIKYSKVENNIDSVVKNLERHQIQLMKDISGLDQLYESNLVYYKELTMYILAGKKSLKKFEKTELAAAKAKAEKSGLPEDAQAAKDMNDMALRFEKKLHDLELTRMIAIQTAPQIRLIQSNDTAMAEKIQSTIVNTIPLWKSRMVLALGIAHSAEAAKAQRAVTDMTNELLKKNAQMLKQASVDTARETERGIVDIETLKETNQTLISTLDEVLTIQADGRQKRKDAEAELVKIEGELKQKLLELSR